MARRALRAADVRRHARARPRDGRAEPRRPEAPAGPRALRDAQRVLPRGARRLRALRRPRRGDAESSLQRPAGQRHDRECADGGRATSTAGRRRVAVHSTSASAARSPTAPRSSSTTARRDRGDHELHEHVEPVGDGRRRAAREQRRRARAARPSRGSRPRSRPARRSSPTTSTAPGSTEPLEELGFNLVGYGCTTCIGNSGPLRRRSRRRSARTTSRSCSVLSGNRNFEGRINPEVQMNYLASPPLVVAYALAGTMDFDLVARAARAATRQGAGVTCATSGPPTREIAETVERGGAVATCSASSYAEVFERRRALELAAGARRATATSGTRVDLRRACRRSSTDMPRRAAAGAATIAGARVLALLGDSVTTDHISPAGSIKRDSPAGRYLQRARRRAARLQLLRRRAAATTR